MTQTPFETSAKFVLWHRRRKGEPWRAIAGTETEAAATAAMAAYPASGEFITLPNGQHPGATWKAKR